MMVKSDIDIHRPEAEACLRSIEEGSKLREGKTEDGQRQKASPGIFRTFQIDREEYVRQWLRDVYGEEL